MNILRVYSWRPRSSINFGDEIGPMVVSKIVKALGFDITVLPTTSNTNPKLLAVGSVLHEASTNDVIWGVGVNAKISLNIKNREGLIFQAVRGPLTRNVVINNGFQCPAVYGDPGLLFPALFNSEIRLERDRLQRNAHALGLPIPKVLFIPNINDNRFLPNYALPESSQPVFVVDPSLSPITVAAYISMAEIVLSSSLHGLVFADAMHIPNSRVESQYEPDFKYNDYYEGTGRYAANKYQSVDAALSGKRASVLNWKSTEFLSAIPLLNISSSKNILTQSFQADVDADYRVQDFHDRVSPFVSGWGEPEGDFIWATEQWADISFLLSARETTDLVLRLHINTLEHGKGDFEIVRAVVNNALLVSKHLYRNKGMDFIDIPLSSFNAGAECNIRLKSENRSRPSDYSESKDQRLLGFYVTRFEIRENQEQLASVKSV